MRLIDLAIAPIAILVLVVVLVLGAVSAEAAAADSSMADAPRAGDRSRAADPSRVATYRLAKIEALPIRIDGRLDDEAWQRAQPFSTFSENLPTAQPTSRHRTELRMLVAGHDLYIGVKSWDDNPSEIRAPLVRRDGVVGDQDFVAI